MAKRLNTQNSQEPIVLEDLLTIKDVAKMLQLSPVRIYHFMRYDGLPSIKVSRSRRIKPSELKAWIDQQNAS